MGVMFVPQQEAWLVERMGKFNTILEPGLNFLIPVLDKVCYLNPQKNKSSFAVSPFNFLLV